MENDFLNLRCGWRMALLYGIAFFFLRQNKQTLHALKTSLKLSK